MDDARNALPGSIVALESGGLYECIRAGYGDYAGEVRLLDGREGECWTSGTWRSRHCCKRVLIGDTLEVTQSFKIEGDRCMNIGAKAVVQRISKGDIMLAFPDMTLQAHKDVWYALKLC